MFVLTWDKLWNYQNQDNYHTTSVLDTGVIRAETVEEVIAQARSLVVNANAHCKLHNLVYAIDPDRTRCAEYYSYEFDDVIREVIGETPFNKTSIETSDEFAKRVDDLKRQGVEAAQKREEHLLAKKRKQLESLKKELGED